MKRLLITLLLAVLSTSAMAEWTPIAQTESATNYAELSTIRKAGNKVKMWIMEDFKTMQVIGEYKYLSAKSQFEYDCQNETLVVGAILMFLGNMGSGQVVTSVSKRLVDPMPVSPGSVGEIAWKIACGKR